MKNGFNCFNIVASGTIYRRETSLQGYYPRILRLGKKEFLASLVAGVGLETPDSHPVLSRSTDGGTTWKLEGPVDKKRPKEFAPMETGFISEDLGGSLMCLGARWLIDPANPQLPLINPATIGMRDNQIVLRHSTDGGHSWTKAEILPKPIPSPLELPTGLMARSDGTYLLSCSTWKDWEGNCPYGHKVLLAYSTNQGKTWNKTIDIFYDPDTQSGYWEGRLTPMGGNKMIATCWAHQWHSDQDLPNHFVLSHDEGKSWTVPSATPVMGQTGWPLWLDGNQILFAYNHRRNPVGIRAQIADVSEGKWLTVYDEEVWSPEDKRSSTISKNDYAVVNFQFGAPSALRLDEKNVMVVYWCVEDKKAGINWTIISLV